MVTPPFRAGECGLKTSRLEDGTSGRDALIAGVPWPRHRHDSQAPPFRRVPSSRRSGLSRSLPALKGGVTVKFAFQASYAFQARTVLLIQDTWEIPQKTFVCQKVLQQPLFCIHLPPEGALDIETTDVNQGYASLSHADGRSRWVRRHDAFATPLFCELQEADLVAVRRITMRRTPHDEFVRADAPHRHIRAETVACRDAQQLQRNGPFARP